MRTTVLPDWCQFSPIAECALYQGASVVQARVSPCLSRLPASQVFSTKLFGLLWMFKRCQERMTTVKNYAHKVRSVRVELSKFYTFLAASCSAAFCLALLRIFEVPGGWALSLACFSLSRMRDWVGAFVNGLSSALSSSDTENMYTEWDPNLCTSFLIYCRWTGM